jgi:hypothetical protein
LFFVATKIHIYLDESGDTGWSFALPFQRGGSSRYFVSIARAAKLRRERTEICPRAISPAHAITCIYMRIFV